MDEVVALGPILRSFPEFNRFYNEERQKRIGFIRWFRDFEMPDGFSAYANNLECAVHYGKSPMSLEDAHIVAHEIMHLIRHQENDLLEIRYRPEFFDLVFRLTNMLEDPIVELFLQKNYDFDLKISYLSAINYCRKCVKKETNDELSRLINGVDLANYMLRWRLIDDVAAQNEWSSYLGWYKNLRPHSYEIADQIVRLVWIHGGAYGAETIENQKKVVAAMINLYPQIRSIISI
ncbi:MAG: hypothetical protein EHM14_11655 [Methanothrix sp.]|nr:MAG: hypothetical protein EHM14_11655 [Methanothrix sp.]